MIPTWVASKKLKLNSFFTIFSRTYDAYSARNVRT